MHHDGRYTRTKEKGHAQVKTSLIQFGIVEARVLTGDVQHFERLRVEARLRPHDVLDEVDGGLRQRRRPVAVVHPDLPPRTLLDPVRVLGHHAVVRDEQVVVREQKFGEHCKWPQRTWYFLMRNSSERRQS